MHELAVTESILKICKDEQRKNSFNKINEIRIRIGELTGLVPDCIDYYFEVISKGTIGEGAKITVEKLPIIIECKECLYKSEIDSGIYSCPKCNSFRISIINGKEFYIDSLEVE